MVVSYEGQLQEWLQNLDGPRHYRPLLVVNIQVFASKFEVAPPCFTGTTCISRKCLSSRQHLLRVLLARDLLVF